MIVYNTETTMTSSDSYEPPTPLPLRQLQPHGLDESAVANAPDNGVEGVEEVTSTHEPFPALENQPPTQGTASLHPLNTMHSAESQPIMQSPHQATPLSASLRIQTDQLAEQVRRENSTDQYKTSDMSSQDIVYNAGLPVRTSSIRSVYKTRAQRTDSLSPGSAMSSPGVGPLVEMTPLPSPISNWGSPQLWKTSTDSDQDEITRDILAEELPEDSPQFTPFTRIPSKRRKVPTLARGIGIEVPIYDAKAAAHARQRSLSDYVPDGAPIPRSRPIVVSTSYAPETIPTISPPQDHMHREEYLAVQRGIAIVKPPSPPDSNVGTDTGSLESQKLSESAAEVDIGPVYEARTISGGTSKRWRALRQLGKGTFSTVMLATCQGMDGAASPLGSTDEQDYDPGSLVAVKVCEHGPAGGADEKKVEVSIKRELELMKAIHHPSLVQLEAVSMLDRQTIMVENYCCGGDLFELASLKLEYLVPSLIRRIFSELVAAVRCLHLQYIVHRDIKLENILVNLKTDLIPTIDDWQTYPSAVVTLTDLGLGRWIPKPPESPMLDTRCGSEDYAAPEVLIGQEYDGRETDAWALGVVLYTVMEGRLPFDPVPGARRRRPTNHKIAGCDWQWFRWADDDAEWDPVKGKDFEGAREVVEGLIAKRRSRWSLEKVEATEWVRGGIDVAGGLRRPYEKEH